MTAPSWEEERPLSMQDMQRTEERRARFTKEQWEGYMCDGGSIEAVSSPEPPTTMTRQTRNPDQTSLRGFLEK